MNLFRISHEFLPKANRGGVYMGKRKADPSTIGLNSSQVEGQGTTETETGSRMESSSRKKEKKKFGSA
jgi:YuzL-like protein